MGDYVLARVVHAESKQECYVPAIVQMTPKRIQDQAKFYTIVMYTGQQVRHKTHRSAFNLFLASVIFIIIIFIFLFFLLSIFIIFIFIIIIILTILLLSSSSSSSLSFQLLLSILETLPS